MYTVEHICNMYNKNHKDLYEAKVEEYLNNNLNLFKDNENAQKVIERDAEDMRNVLRILDCGDIDTAVEVVVSLDTLVRDYLAYMFIENK